MPQSFVRPVSLDKVREHSNSKTACKWHLTQSSKPAPSIATGPKTLSSNRATKRPIIGCSIRSSSTRKGGSPILFSYKTARNSFISSTRFENKNVWKRPSKSKTKSSKNALLSLKSRRKEETAAHSRSFLTAKDSIQGRRQIGYPL